MSSDIGEKARVIVLAALMVLSVVAMTTAFAGSAAAKESTLYVDGTGTGDNVYAQVDDALGSASNGDTIVINASDEYNGFTADVPNVTITTNADGPVEITTAVDVISDDVTIQNIQFNEEPFEEAEEDYILFVDGDNAEIENITSTAAPDNTNSNLQNTDDITILSNNTVIRNSNLTDDPEDKVSYIHIGAGRDRVNQQEQNNDDRGGDGVVLQNNTITDGSVAVFIDEEESVTIEENTFSRSNGVDPIFVVDDGVDSFNAPPESAEVTVQNNEGLAAVVNNDASDGPTYYTVNVQGAVDKALEGANIDVFPGSYDESVSISTANVTLESMAGADSTTINATGGTGVTLKADTDGLTIRGFTIEEAPDFGINDKGGNNNVTIVGNVLSDNDVAMSIGNAFTNTGTRSTNVTIENNIVNKSNKGGLQVRNVNNTVIRKNHIIDNDQNDVDYWGALFIGTYSKAGNNILIEDNEISGNTGQNGLVLHAETSPDEDPVALTNVEISGNNISNNEYNGTYILENTIIDDVAVNNNNIVGNERAGVANDGVEVLNATSNWWGATNGPSGDFDGNGSAVTGSVTVDPATVSLEDGSVNLTQDFLGVVKDSQNVTLNDTSDATFSFDSESVPGDVDGTLVLGINGTDYVFEDVLDDGAINTSASGAEVDSGKNGTSIANTTPTGDTTITVVGNNSTTAVDETGSVTLVHEAIELDEGFNLKSVPQPAKLYTQDVESTNQWNPSEGSYEGLEPNEGENIDSGTDLHRGLYVEAENDDARLGYSFSTDEVPTPDSVAMGNGWHLVGSNFDIDSESGSRTLDNDLRNVENVTTEGGPGVTAYDSELSGTIGGDAEINEYETYWVFVDDSQERTIVTPNYDPDER